MDALNGNTVWYDATEKEVKLIQDDFEYICIGEESGITDDYQKIPLLWTFAVKFYRRHRARLCAGGHRTRGLETDLYRVFVELETILIIFVIELLKGFNAVYADVASACIQEMIG